MADAQGKFVAAEPLFDDLPRGWIRTTLEKVGTWNSGGTPSRKVPAYFGGSIPWAKIGDLEDRTLRETEELITAEGLASSSAKIVPAGTLLLAMYGASIGKLGVAGLPCATNQAIACGQLHPTVTSPEYVFKYLLHSRHQLIEMGQGGAQPNVSQGIVKAFPILVPPLAEQRRIVSRIDELFSRIEAGERAIAAARRALKRYRKSVLKAAVTGALTADWREMRGEPNETGHQLLARTLKDREQLAKRDLSLLGVEDAAYELPSCWAWTTLDRLTVLKGGVTVDRKKLPDDPVTLPYLRVANVQDGRIDLSEIKKITVERKKGADCLLRKGDILLNEGGDLDKLGRGWVWDEQIAPCIHQNHVFRARPVNADINPYFVSHYANTLGRTFFMENGKQSVNLASISLTQISKLPVPLPPSDEQAEIVSRVEEALSRIDHAEATLDVQSRNARALKQSILKSAFEGRLVPQDAKDEPAADMMARTADEPLVPKTKTKARA